MIVQFIRFETTLTEEEVMNVATERIDQFRALAGLLQKYYVKLEQPNHYGGIYIWESREALGAFRQSEMAASIPASYQIVGKPNIEIMEGVFQLQPSG